METGKKSLQGNILVGNAPVSWGVMGNNLNAPGIPAYTLVLDEIAKSGYQGTELGPYGYLPTNPDDLGKELNSRSLKLASSFVPLELHDDEGFRNSENELLTVTKLLSSFNVPYIIVSSNWTDERVKYAGSIKQMKNESWSEPQWQQACGRLNILAERVKQEFNMTLVFHHHAGTWVETDDEVEKLLRLTEPELVGFCLDTGHYVYGGGDPVAAVRQWYKRIRYVHLKDIRSNILEKVRKEKIDSGTAWEMGIFPELGNGSIDFPAFSQALQAVNYNGWLIVEQDIIPGLEGEDTHTPFESARLSRTYVKRVFGV